MPERVYTLQEAAAVLEISPRTAWKMAKAGVLAGFKVGVGRGHWRVNASDLDRYILKSRRTQRAALKASGAGIGPDARREGGAA